MSIPQYYPSVGTGFNPITPNPFARVQQLLRVNGIESARAYPTAPNSTYALFDENDDVMYIKTTDSSNYPTIKRYRFYEEAEQQPKMDGLSNSDVALLERNNGMFGGDSGAFWIFALLLLAGGGFGGFGGNGNYATQAEMNAGFANQQTKSKLQQIALSSANNNYETAQLIGNQNMQMMRQNNTNLINAIQGFNQVQQSLAQQNNQVLQAIGQLSYQMDQCCCSIKTQMLQDRLDDTQAQLVAAQGAISNANQSQYLLGQLGRFVAWTPSGSQAASL